MGIVRLAARSFGQLCGIPSNVSCGNDGDGGDDDDDEEEDDGHRDARCTRLVQNTANK